MNTLLAPGQLELVCQFVNTLDVEAGTDDLATADAWEEWATERDTNGDASAQDLARLRALRESLREGLIANQQRRTLPDDTARALEDAMRWSRADISFTAGGLAVETDAVGPKGLAGAVVGAVADALADGTWTRLRACGNENCRWAFYDHSRSRTGQWCSMGICGNRSKQSRWRERQRA